MDPPVEDRFPRSCGKVLAHGAGWVRMAPDTPETIPGNGQYFFLTRILPHSGHLRLKIEWPQTSATELPGFYYPGNENYAAVLDQVCFRSPDLGKWEAIHEVEGTTTGVNLVLPPEEAPVFISVGIPYLPESLERLLADMEAAEVCRLEKIGTSRNGRPVHGLLFEPGEHSECKGLFVLQGYQHHTEWAGLFALDSLARGLADGRLDRGDFAWAIVPCLNVDSLYGGWKEDRMHTHPGNGKCGNLNRDWGGFEYPETAAAGEWYTRLSEKWTVLHGLDIHMGWNAPDRSGGGLTVFKKGMLPEEASLHEAAFTRHFFEQVPIEPFAWEVTEVERPNFAAWVWRRFGAIGQTMEVSRFLAYDREGQPQRTSQAYYQGLGPAVANCLMKFYNHAKVPVQPIR
ncbi:MAG: M14 family zinc carboxypeptidase [Oceanipulchritudo sp.]